MTAINKTPELLAEEQIGPKGWIRNVICLELAADYDATKITTILRTAWASFKSRTPIVGTEAVPQSPDSKPAGMLKLQVYSDNEIEDFVVKDHRSDASILPFAELQSQGFPNSAMDNDKLCLRGRGGEWPRPGDRLATNFMQANLVVGGLLLNHLCFHAFGDGCTMWKLLELFAEDVRRAQGLVIDEPAEIPMEDRAKMLQSTGERVCSDFAQEHNEFIHLPFTPDALPPGLTQVPHHANVFRFSPEAINALKEECSPANVRLLKDKGQLPGFVSTNDALTALLWRSVQRAEHAGTTLDASAVSIVAVSLDTRRRTHVPIHPHTLGNMCGYAAADLPLTQLLSNEQTSLADLACLVRMTVGKSGSSYHDEIAHYIERMDDVSRLAGTAFLDMPGNNVLQSNWSDFDYYGIQWGPIFGNTIKAVRFPAGGVCAGFQIVMPSPPPNTPVGTIEVLVDLSEGAWEHLKADETWRAYASNPTTVEY